MKQNIEGHSDQTKHKKDFDLLKEHDQDLFRSGLKAPNASVFPNQINDLVYWLYNNI